MNHLIWRTISLCSRNQTSTLLFTSLQSSSSSIFMNNRFFSSENPNPNLPVPDSKLDQLDRVVDPVSNDSQFLSNEVLKKKIDRLIEGDGDAIPEIFEAILKRKLTGKSDEADEELMKEIRSNPLLDQDFSDSEFDATDEVYDDSGKEDESD